MDTEANAEIAQDGPAVGEQEDVAGGDIAVDHAVFVGMGESVKDLGDDSEDAARGHWFGAVGECADGHFGGKDGVPFDDVGIFEGHDVWMSQAGDESDFA